MFPVFKKTQIQAKSSYCKGRSLHGNREEDILANLCAHHRKSEKPQPYTIIAVAQDWGRQSCGWIPVLPLDNSITPYNEPSWVPDSSPEKNGKHYLPCKVFGRITERKYIKCLQVHEPWFSGLKIHILDIESSLQAPRLHSVLHYSTFSTQTGGAPCITVILKYSQQLQPHLPKRYRDSSIRSLTLC